MDGVGSDWPIGYHELRAHYERCERECPVAGERWPWGDPHSYPHSPRPVGRAGLAAWRGTVACGIEMRAGPVGIVAGRFGNRPPCIDSGLCAEGCKVGAKASPLVTHLPDAVAHGAEVRGGSMACRVPLEGGRAAGVEYVGADGQGHLQRARVVALAGGAVETPRLLLNSAQRGFPSGLCNNEDQVGRYLMVHGAPQVAGRFPSEIRMYKGAQAQLSSEQFYETDERRGFARGCSLHTVASLPIGWAEHVIAEGYWGAGLRERMRDYNHWAALGGLNELLSLPENRVTVASGVADELGLPVARVDYGLCDNDRSSIAHTLRLLREIWVEAGAEETMERRGHAHLMGGCRMGRGPTESVCDSAHRTWAVPNLFVADGSVLPTAGSAHPALTIMALSSRLAERLAAAG
jgi:choline dehydrogenase-like flavoprotein